MKSYSQPNAFYAQKKSLSYKENLKSWNRGTKKKIISEPSPPMGKSYRGGLILT